ncbi:MAG: hypothetical protein VYC34_08410, partial [Planctomycetota bacterium]|nr:hypothetical protein [Planctomycetota bacterium]
MDARGCSLFLAGLSLSMIASGPGPIDVIEPFDPLERGAACPADLDGDGAVGASDLGILLGAFGACPGCPADFNMDGRVAADDLAFLLGSWGPCVPVVTAVVFEARNNVIDANPNAGGGMRVFPDDQMPGDPIVRNFVTVKATVNPPRPGIMVHFRPFDVDDPSANAAGSLIDQNDAGGMPTGDDNRGRFAVGTFFTPDTPRLSNQGGYDGRVGTSPPTVVAEGAIASVPTNAMGMAEVVLQVTFAPGDNFRVAASTNMAQVMALQDDAGAGGGPAVPSGNNPMLGGFMGMLTPTLTVWRNLHVEFNSMGPADNTLPSSDLFGVITDQSMPAMGSTAITITSLTDADEDWQPNSQLIGALLDPDTADANADALEVTASTMTTVTVKAEASVGGIALIAGVVVVDGETFTVSDGGTDGGVTATTFEFDIAPGNGVAGGNVAIVVPAAAGPEALEAA